MILLKDGRLNSDTSSGSENKPQDGLVKATVLNSDKGNGFGEGKGDPVES